MAAVDAEPVPPPLQHLPTAKEKKYDRQLRLWGAAGQIALEETHVLLVQGSSGSGVTGVEALKNLVLPGIGAFTVADTAVVDEADLGVNFFLTNESLGRFRADETVRLLRELNPEVEGHGLKEPIESLVAREDAFDDYTLILVAAPVDPAVLAAIQDRTLVRDIPLFYIHSIGFYASFSVALPEAFPIVDTHPDATATTDLRLLRPWSALEDFAREKTSHMESMNAHDKAHIPYICLLLHYLEEWRSHHDGNVPETYREKQAFRDNYVGRDSPHEENFQEAAGAVLKSLNPVTPSSAVREIFLAPEAKNLSAKTPPFWVIANALHEFYLKHGELPLPGAVPDMKAQSADYLRLQNIYKTKARQDCAEVVDSVRRLEQSTGRRGNLAIDEREIENFCKGAAHVHLVRGLPLLIMQPGTTVSFGERAEALSRELTNPESLIATYIAMLAWDEFVATHRTEAHDTGGEGMRVPGSDDGTLDDDAEKLTGIARSITDTLISQGKAQLEEDELEQFREGVGKVCVELARAAGGELHNIASLAGGLVAQEAIKVVTRQYVPVDNTCVFDGVASRSYVLRV